MVEETGIFIILSVFSFLGYVVLLMFLKKSFKKQEDRFVKLEKQDVHLFELYDHFVTCNKCGVQVLKSYAQEVQTRQPYYAMAGWVPFQPTDIKYYCKSHTLPYDVIITNKDIERIRYFKQEKEQQGIIEVDDKGRKIKTKAKAK